MKWVSFWHRYVLMAGDQLRNCASDIWLGIKIVNWSARLITERCYDNSSKSKTNKQKVLYQFLKHYDQMCFLLRERLNYFFPSSSYMISVNCHIWLASLCLTTNDYIIGSRTSAGMCAGAYFVFQISFKSIKNL